MIRNPNMALLRWKSVALGLALILIGLIVWDGADRRPPDPSQRLPQGSSMVDLPVSSPSLKLASFNIHGGKGTDGVRSLPQIAELLKTADFVGLYEVRAGVREVGANQAAALATSCNASWVFAATERQWWSDHFGNGLISRGPLRSPIRIPLMGTRGKAFRNAIFATVPLQDAEVHILAVHIDRESDRRHQLQTMVDLFLSLEPPCVLMGDLNTTASDPLLTTLLEHPGVKSPLHEQFAGRIPSQNIDWIFTRGLATISAELIETTASDHPLLHAELIPIARKTIVLDQKKLQP